LDIFQFPLNQHKAAMNILRDAVSHYLVSSNESFTYTALEAFRQRKGDCTEHANLLAAALRISGVPCRVDSGHVFFAERGEWVGHAWVTAWDSEALSWVHLDAALPGVPRSAYIRTGSQSDGPQGEQIDAKDNFLVLSGQRITALDPATIPAEP
jgi:transglutaminase-like putative cysteine protease